MLARIVLLCLIALNSACATTIEPSPEPKAAIVKPDIQVQPTSQTSPHLFAIEDPLTLAVEARVAGEPALAYRHFYAAWLATPQNEDVVLGLINMALKTGDIKTAYQAASNLDEDIVTAKPALLAAQVLAEIAAGKSPDPEVRLNQALEYVRHDPRLWNALGRHHDRAGKPLRAQETYLQALSVGGSDEGVLNNLGMSYLMQGRKEEALSKFDQAANLAPENTLYDNNRRLTLALLNNYNDATEGLSEDRAADLLNDAGYIAKTRKDTESAAALFKAAIKRSYSYHAKAHANLRALKKADKSS